MQLSQSEVKQKKLIEINEGGVRAEDDYRGTEKLIRESLKAR